MFRQCPVTERLPALMQVSSLQLLLSAQFAACWEFLTMATFLHFAGSAVLLEDRKTTWTGIGQPAVFLRVTHHPKESPRIIQPEPPRASCFYPDGSTAPDPPQTKHQLRSEFVRPRKQSARACCHERALERRFLSCSIGNSTCRRRSGCLSRNTAQ